MKMKAMLEAAKPVAIHFVKTKGPKIGLVGGIVLMAAAGGYAVYKSVKEDELSLIFWHHKESRHTFENLKADEFAAAETDEQKEEIEEKYNKEIRKDYFQQAGELIKHFAVPTLLFTTGAALTFGSYKIMALNIAELQVGYEKLAAANKILLAKTSGVIDQETEVEKDSEKAPTHENVQTAVNDGLLSTEYGPAPVIVAGGEPYSYWWGEINESGMMNKRFYDESMDMNIWYVQTQARYFDALLETRGYVLLNEVLEKFDLPIVPYGWEVGWVYDLANPALNNRVVIKAREYYLYRDDEGNWEWEPTNTDKHSPDDDLRCLLTFIPDGIVDDYLYQSRHTDGTIR